MRVTVARRLGLAALAGGLLGSPARAFSGVIAAPTETTSVAAFPDVGNSQPLPVGTAAFPDVEPAAPSPPPDAVLALLTENPYAADLAAAVRAEDEARQEASPYAKLMQGPAKETDAPLENPYIDELRLLTSESSEIDSPYAAARGH